MQQKITSSRILLATLLLLVICGLAFFVGIIRRLHTNLSITKTMQATVARYEENRGAWRQAKATFGDDKAVVATLGTYVITQSSTPEFLSSLEEMAQEYKVEFLINNVATSPIDTNPGLLIGFTFKGTFENTTAFLDALTRKKPVMVFQSFSLEEVAKEATDQSGKTFSQSATPLWQGVATMRVISYSK